MPQNIKGTITFNPARYEEGRKSSHTDVKTCFVQTLPAERPGKDAPTGPGVPKKEKGKMSKEQESPVRGC